MGILNEDVIDVKAFNWGSEPVGDWDRSLRPLFLATDLLHN